MHDAKTWQQDLMSFIKPDEPIGALVYFVLFVTMALLLSRGLRAAVHAALAKEAHVDRTAINFLQQIGSALIWLCMVILYAHLIPQLRAVGTALLAGAGVASVVIGLAAQSTLGNLVAGISMTIYRPFRLGDVLQVSTPTGTEIGTVDSISLGYTTLRVQDGRFVVLPNSVAASQVTLNLSPGTGRWPASIAIRLSRDADIGAAMHAGPRGRRGGGGGGGGHRLLPHQGGCDGGAAGAAVPGKRWRQPRLAARCGADAPRPTICRDRSRRSRGPTCHVLVTAGKLRVGVSGWSIAARYEGEMPGGGSHLERYARNFSAVEITTSFYRHHQLRTYERWASCVGPEFRFAVKTPRALTHEGALIADAEVLDRFVSEVEGLGRKLQVLLVQLPPSLEFMPADAARFFTQLQRRIRSVAVVCEPRHPSWNCPAAKRCSTLRGYRERRRIRHVGRRTPFRAAICAWRTSACTAPLASIFRTMSRSAWLTLAANCKPPCRAVMRCGASLTTRPTAMRSAMHSPCSARSPRSGL